MQLVSGQKAVVVGLGDSGLSVVRFLLDQGCRVGVTDRQSLRAIDPSIREYLDRNGVALETDGHTSGFLRDADLIVPSPGVPLNIPVLTAAAAQGKEITGELGLAAGRFSVPVIGVTGSNGKTTVTDLIGHLLASSGRSVFVGGNIGTPLLDYFSMQDEADVVVLELSSFQLDLAGAFRPDIGLLLNISPDHLDRHGSMDAYTMTKAKLFSHQEAGDVAIIGADDRRVCSVSVPGGVSRLQFGMAVSNGARVTPDGVELSLQIDGRKVEEAYNLETTQLHSLVNRLNSASAILACTLAGCSFEGVHRGLQTYTPPLHRMTKVATVEGVCFINDSKATNIGALKAALSSCTAPVILIAGGRGKGGDFNELQPVARDHLKYLVLIGEAADDLKQALGGIVPAVCAGSMQEAVHLAARGASPGDIVLLAPGCASFDMFSGYPERGRVFSDCVRELQGD